MARFQYTENLFFATLQSATCFITLCFFFCHELYLVLLKAHGRGTFYDPYYLCESSYVP